MHLAAELQAKGASVVLVDCDVQGSATYWAEPGKLPMRVEHMPLESNEQVAEWSNSIKSLRADYIILDSPPHLNAALGGVIGLSDLAVVPCGPSGMDLIATGETIGLIREIRAARGDNRPALILVPNRTDKRTASGKELADTLAEMGELVAPEIRSRTAFSDAFNSGQWVGAYMPESPAHAEMTALANFVLKQIRKIDHDQAHKFKGA